MQSADDVDETRTLSRNQQVDPQPDNGASRGAASRSLPCIVKSISFQKLLLLAVTRLSIYVFKLVEDAKSVKEYKEKDEDISFMLLSAACLIIPSLFYSVYLMGQNLTKDDIIDKRELGTKAVNGLLLIPWQIKRHLDVLHFAAQRVCMWRPPDKQEDQDLQTMKRNAEVLEFFEDLYAGFIQILLQVYLFYLGSFLYGEPPALKDKYLATQLIASCLSATSLLVAVRRRDDGPLTGFLSFFGWTSMIISRVLVMSLAATVLHGWIATLALVHVLAISIWIYRIAVDSYIADTVSVDEETIQWANTRKRVSTAIMVFLFFGIPSLIIWPIMFQLKDGKRPLIFLTVMVVENLLLLGLWFAHQSVGQVVALNSNQTLLVAAIVIATLGGAFFLLIYILCKPKFTDQVVLHEIRENRTQEAATLIKQTAANSRSSNATQYGIYYEFCDLVFKLPSTHKIASDLEEIRALTRGTAAPPPIL